MLLLLQIILITCFASAGGAIASFLCVVWERVPRKESINGRSHCVCGRQLQWWENIPIIGWLRVKGTTQCCNQKIPIHYLLAEIIGFITFGAIGAIIIFSIS